MSKMLTCESCRYFDKRNGWCSVYAAWRSRYTVRCAYGLRVILGRQAEGKAQTRGAPFFYSGGKCANSIRIQIRHTGGELSRIGTVQPPGGRFFQPISAVCAHRPKSAQLTD